MNSESGSNRGKKEEVQEYTPQLKNQNIFFEKI